MDTFKVSVLPELSQVGTCTLLDGRLDEQGYSAGALSFDVADGIDYSIQLANTGEAITVSGHARAHVRTSCARCLEPAELDVEGEVQGYFLIEHVDDVEGMEPDEYDFVDDDGSLDLHAPIMAALVHETPFVVLCDEDCKGLCPRCGANLNEGPCSCDAGAIDPANPFAALKNYKFE